MNNAFKLGLPARFAAIAAIAALLSIACGGSATTSGDHNVGAGTSGAGTAGAGATGGIGGTRAQAGAGGSGGKTVQLGPGSWQMTGIVTSARQDFPVFTCATVAFTLNVTPDGSGYSATIGQDGFIDGTSAEITNGSYVLDGLALPCSTQLTVSGLTLQGTDADGDGKADGLSGTVSGMAYSGGGDIVTSGSVQIDLTGVPDVTAPTLLQPDTVDPLRGFAIRASEPILSTASLSLVGTTNIPLTGNAARSSSLATQLDEVITWSASGILPLSGQWTVQGQAQDPSGHALNPAAVLRTLTDPGVFSQDGFEGTLAAAIEAGAPSLVTGLGSVPAISGANSLWIAPGDTILFHLKRASTEKTLHFSARAFSEYGAPSADAYVWAGVIGGQPIQTPNITPSGGVVDTGDSVWKQATEVQQFTFPLKEAGADVLLRIWSSACVGFCPPPSALMIDDLALE